ncbi:YHYH protein [Tenacibaculum aiptasiae]|uniref:YHYH protein n=1 Tax=Tenacibaculum aiptasiae TaxID=426481 RepID=A0A7J5AMA3_9FLAO|nr:YHYH protein [Tenacibaculum aiptasiae]KAB1158686.1 YHYH protein [Tenacibaculum aiptasiae]
MNLNQLVKTLLGLLVVTSVLYACSSSDDVSDGGDGSNPSGTTYDITPILSKFDGVSGVTYAINGNVVTFTTNNLPNHKSPYWGVGNANYEAYNGTNPNWNQNPNTIASQNITFQIPLNPSEASTKTNTSLGPMGLAINGVAFYNQYAGPNNQPLTNEINSFDQYLGHPQNSGQYHYHQEPLFLTAQNGKSAFLGLLADGFPVYGPEENGTTITSADLDIYHGHTSATADFPNGIYHYHITADDPYINGNAFYGTPGNISQ